MKQVDSHIEQEVQQTLAVSDRIGKVQANPFLFSRVEAALDQEPLPLRSFRWQIIVASIVVLLNVAVISWDWHQESQEADLVQMQSIWSDYELDLDQAFVFPTQQDRS